MNDSAENFNAGSLSPVVSVCIQTYQHVDFIAECIESVLAQQTNFPFEIILGEDESVDGTRAVCEEYAAKYPGKIRLFLRSRKDVIYCNGKATGRYNLMQNLLACKGKYIAICEGDDYWTDPLKLQKQYDILEAKPEIALTYHWQRIAFADRSGKYSEKEAPKDTQGYFSRQLTDAGDIFTFRLRPQSRTLMFRNIFSREAFPAWFYKVQFGDLSLCFILGRHGKYYFLDEEMAVYRMTGKGASSIFNSKKGYITGNKAWLSTWAYALKHHENKYEEQAFEGIQVFLSRIRKATDNSLLTRLNLVWFILFKLEFRPAFKRKLVRLLLKRRYES